MLLSEELKQKWQPILEHPELEAIKDPYKKAVTAMVLENQSQAMASDRAQMGLINETTSGGPSMATGGGVQNFDPILISLVRRALPNLIAYDVAGVQPMTGPTGLIFAMRAKYGQDNTAANKEAFYNEANTKFSGIGSDTNRFGFANNTTGDTLTNPVGNGFTTANTFTTGIGMPTATAEYLGSEANTQFGQMAFSIGM